MRKKILLSILAVIVLLITAAYFFVFRASTNDIKVLVFSKTAGYRHESIETGIEAIRKLGVQHNFIVEATEDAQQFNEAYLKDFQVIVFLNTTSDVLDPVQQSQVERFIQAGGGFVGVHAAADTEYGWPWYGEMVGAYFDSHPLDPNVQEGVVHVTNPNHQATDSLPQSWKTPDEWYNFKSIYPGNKVLLTIDESTYTGGTNGSNHPIAWYKEYDGGRSFYTGLGHTKEQYADPLFLSHLLGGIRYAIGPGSLIDYSKAYAEVVPEENRFSKVTFTQNLAEPMELDFLDQNKILFIERKGTVHIYDLETARDSVIARLEVFSGLEDGLLGMALDPEYATNNWVYLYYSDPGEQAVQKLSRFVLKDYTLDLGSEKVLLEVKAQREECCHSGGSLEFGPNGNLFLSTGDNTNPHASNGFAPIDERDGRAPWDAQKSAANTNDLRGKILRIKPEADGTYSIPEGNLFGKDNPKGRPEIYVMGNRNPYRISIDSRTGYLYWGEVGPDASKDSLSLGVMGYDEVNQARQAGNYGWPYFIADNKVYHAYNFATNTSGAAFNPDKPQNNSPNNTGMQDLPPAQPAMIYYPYSVSEEFPALGTGSRNAMAGPVFYTDDYPESGRKFPDYFDGKLLIYDWMRGWIFAVTMTEDGDLDKLTRIVPNMALHNVIDMVFGPDGALYILEYGSGWFSQNVDATLSRIEFTKGNRIPLARITTDKAIGATPLTVNFSGRNSIDYDGDQLSYQWDFGESDASSTESETAYTFEASGKFTVKLKVEDEEGNVAETETQIIVGNELPQLSWEITRGNSDFYWPGKAVDIAYQIHVSDAEDGSLKEGTLNASDVLVSFDYLPEGNDQVAAAKSHADLADNAYASIGKGLMDASDCMACHKEKEKSIGPSYQAIADRYALDNSAAALLADKIVNGGGGNWGETPMAAHPGLSQSDVDQMVKYILSLSEQGQSGNPSKYPVKGSYSSEEHRNSDTKGSYILTASYTDKGGGNIEPLTAKQTLLLRYPHMEAESSDEGSSMTFFVNADETPGIDEDMTIAVGTKGSYLMFREIDLSEVKAIRGRYGLVKGITQGGDVEFRLGGLDGELISSLELKVGLTDFKLEEIRSPFNKQINGKQDLYIIFKNEEAKDGDLITVLDWFELLNE
ncbi:ThuA domain-containing protein [Poritiphilus flavus]|uniref:PKD domain-containing protein n=1 Tax=Poritiphilus flavus TaxID=2697053 RepID=A0A6L9E9X0_9FLAO|nr:ThuA domain-containing protein [Poritiphilus flavus]NAS11506.1 PKD domain-containing protein [Poritiphilus flavus]